VLLLSAAGVAAGAGSVQYVSPWAAVPWPVVENVTEPETHQRLT